jgi:hypothetical protein
LPVTDGLRERHTEGLAVVPVVRQPGQAIRAGELDEPGVGLHQLGIQLVGDAELLGQAGFESLLFGDVHGHAADEPPTG